MVPDHRERRRRWRQWRGAGRLRTAACSGDRDSLGQAPTQHRSTGGHPCHRGSPQVTTSHHGSPPVTTGHHGSPPGHHGTRVTARSDRVQPLPRRCPSSYRPPAWLGSAAAAIVRGSANRKIVRLLAACLGRRTTRSAPLHEIGGHRPAGGLVIRPGRGRRQGTGTCGGTRRRRSPTRSGW